MVSGVDEILAVREFLAKETESLLAKGVAVGSPRVGAMIEVPSAVFLIEEIVTESDIVCLGTNDLVQYLLAVDRDNEAGLRLVPDASPGRHSRRQERDHHLS
jgi:phosphoenolpyruvate-protein kinase (PTS system EI component)